MKNDILMHKYINGIYVTENEIQVLKRFGFDINKYKSLKMLLFDIEKYLEDYYDEDLDDLASSLAEFNYYHNTVK